MLHLALLAVDARGLAIGLPVWLYDDYPRLRLVYLSMLLRRRVVGAGIEVVGTATEQQG